MNEQNNIKILKDIFHDLCFDNIDKDKMREGLLTVLESLGPDIDAKPEHPSNGEFVEYWAKDTPAYKNIGYAFALGIYMNSFGVYPPMILWNEYKYEWRIIPDPDKCIMIDQAKEWPSTASKLEYTYRFYDEYDRPSSISYTIKTITREELEAK